jgi:hypothetical protein
MSMTSKGDVRRLKKATARQRKLLLPPSLLFFVIKERLCDEICHQKWTHIVLSCERMKLNLLKIWHNQ